MATGAPIAIILTIPITVLPAAAQAHIIPAAAEAPLIVQEAAGAVAAEAVVAAMAAVVRAEEAVAEDAEAGSVIFIFWSKKKKI
ncbi:MAG: hypothetical protein K2J70_00790 [Muribaculaceae bacterium]|nr:hypothetical protein [Muribaculaceae bacterium]